MLKKTITYSLILMFIASCATPKAMDVRQVNDYVMSCDELMLAFEQADLSEDEAHAEKGTTDGNILSGLFFFPAYFVSYGTSVRNFCPTVSSRTGLDPNLFLCSSTFLEKLSVVTLGPACGITIRNKSALCQVRTC